MIELVFALAVASVAAFHDLRTRTLPRWLTLGATFLAPAVHVVGAAVSGARGADLLAAIGGSAAGALACAVLPFLLMRRNAMGRGDLDLFIALGAVLGPAIGFEVQLYALSAAFVAAPILAWRSGRLKTALSGAWSVFRGKKREEKTVDEASWMPFAPAIFGGVLLTAMTS